MQRTVILKVAERRSLFANKFECDDYEHISVITTQSRKSALRKLKKAMNGENIVVSRFGQDEYIFNNRLKVYDTLSYKTVLPVINKICRQLAVKNRTALPFGEIYIFAEPTAACELILPLMDLGRLFTVVSNEPFGMMADELYFKYGCVIRRISKLDDFIKTDAVIIRADDTEIYPDMSVPVIDITDLPLCGENVLKAREVSVSDDKVLYANKEWGGCSGLVMYELIGELPSENAEVDINIKADRIFLLDIEKI